MKIYVVKYYIIIQFVTRALSTFIEDKIRKDAPITGVSVSAVRRQKDGALYRNRFERNRKSLT